MKRLLLFLPLFFLLACNEGPPPSALVVSPKAFDARLKETPDALLLDVRTPEEYAEGHIAGAKNADWNSEAFAKMEPTLDKKKPVFLYCLSGGRSGQAAQKLHADGFLNVVELDGGLLKWRAAGMPEGDAAASTTKAGKKGGMTPAEFAALLASEKPVLVDVSATWCGPCKLLAPTIDALEKAGNAKIVRIDADDNPDLCESLGVDALPTLMVYKGGKQTWRNVGLVGKATIEKEL